jgi:hypothetical protein
MLVRRLASLRLADRSLLGTKIGWQAQISPPGLARPVPGWPLPDRAVSPKSISAATSAGSGRPGRTR